jgi:hypothetical protein
MSPPSEPLVERSPEARALAERALIQLLNELEGTGVELVVLGGLVPEVLTEGQDPPAPQHLGTADVDLLLRARIDADEDLFALESALLRLEFEPSPLDPWRWRGDVSGRGVKVEFLCDLGTQPDTACVPVPGCAVLEAKNLHGTGYVAHDCSTVLLRSRDDDGRETSAQARFARLGGYLLSKCVAARSRGENKDYYDLIYVLLHNRAGGPAEAAAEVIASGFGEAVAGELHSTLIEVRERFRSPTQVGPSGFAAQSLQVHPDESEVGLRADAVAAAAEFFEPLLSERG